MQAVRNGGVFKLIKRTVKNSFATSSAIKSFDRVKKYREKYFVDILLELKRIQDQIQEKE